MRYVMRRVFNGLLLLVGVSILAFLLTRLAPGEFFQEMRLNPRIAQETIAALRARYGMDETLPAQYCRWLYAVLRGDFGFSFAYNMPVYSLLRPRLVNTLILAVPAALLAWIIAIPAGIWCASRRGKWVDQVSAAGTSFLLAIPDLVLGLALLLFAVRTGFFPAGGMHSVGFEQFTPGEKIRDFALHIFLPCTALVLGTLPTLVRHTRAAIIETLAAPFVRTALAHGISWRRILWRHILPVAANPLISLFGVSLGTLLSASLLIEVIMSWPGLGPLVLEAILARDLYLVIGAVMISTACLLAGNLSADLMLYAVDPRIRKERS